MKYMLIILSYLMLAGVAAAQDEFFFVDSATGVTNGPYDVHDYGTFRLAGHDYTIRRDTTRLEFESAVIPSVDFRDVSVRQAIDTILVDGIFASNRVPRVEILKESMVTNVVSFIAFAIKVGDTIDILAELADLEIIRDRKSQTIILIPRSFSDGRSARAYDILPGQYDRLDRPRGEFHRLLVRFGVMRNESQLTTEFKRERSRLLLYGSAKVIREFERRVTILRVNSSPPSATPRLPPLHTPDVFEPL
jgi:hypothetical protein